LWCASLLSALFRSGLCASSLLYTVLISLSFVLRCALRRALRRALNLVMHLRCDFLYTPITFLSFIPLLLFFTFVSLIFPYLTFHFHSLSIIPKYSKQMFSYGAIKPLLLASDSNFTNNACMLSGLGCVTQLCRIPEIGIRMVQQGSIPLLEMGLHKATGHGNRAIREKSLYSLGFLSKIDSVRGKLMSPIVRAGLIKEFEHGTMSGKATIMQLLMNVHNKYDGEIEYVHA
jgi:hypothetical protein